MARVAEILKKKQYAVPFYANSILEFARKQIEISEAKATLVPTKEQEEANRYIKDFMYLNGLKGGVYNTAKEIVKYYEASL